jgi:hypothetical protein
MFASSKAERMLWQFYLVNRSRSHEKIETEANDELRPEYDLKELRVRRVGPGLKRGEILKNAEAGLEEQRDGKLKSFSNADDLTDSLSHD